MLQGMHTQNSNNKLDTRDVEWTHSCAYHGRRHKHAHTHNSNNNNNAGAAFEGGHVTTLHEQLDVS
jgi:hypothetical protein